MPPVMTSDHEEQREVLRAQLRSKATKNPADMELYELSQLSGITMDPHVFEIFLDLLRKNVPPEAVVHMLRSMCSVAYQKLQQKNTSLPPASSSSAAASHALPVSAAREDHYRAEAGVHSKSQQIVRDPFPSPFLGTKSSSFSDLPAAHSRGQHSSQRAAAYGSASSSRGNSSSSNKVSSQTDTYVTSRPRIQSSRSHHTSVGQSAGSKRRSYHQ